jgi:histidinol-phosphate aminotransferase
MIDRAIVLAAGKGSRLVAADELPKPLKPIAAVPLLVRILRTLQAEGIREALIVVGHRGDAIRRALMREPSLVLKLAFVDNAEYDKSNGVSVLAARAFIENGAGDCLLTMADHLYSPEIVRRLQAFDLPPDACALAVDHDPERCFDIDDATKVMTESGRIVRIGKELEDFDVLDTGVFRIGPALVSELQRVYRQKGDCSLSDGVGALARQGRMYACGIGDARWIDVDTPEAAQRAEAMLHVFGESLGDEPNGNALPDPAAIELFSPSWVRAAQPYNEEHFAFAEQNRDVVRMMSNESPYSPSPRVIDAVMRAALGGNLYPSGATDLRTKLAERAGVGPDHVLLGAGSAELIDLVVRTFVAPGEEVLISTPTFSMYEARTRVAGGIPVKVPMCDGELDLPGMISSINERTKVIFVCTPNNPTGTLIPESQLRRILALGLPTVIDEAYYELSTSGASYHFLVAEYPNALVLRTFSKAFGLAGMRVGYALGHPAQIRLLSRVKVPWNLSSLAIAAACAALDDAAEQETRLEALRDGRSYLERELSRLPGLKIHESEGNFVLVDAHKSGMTADEIVAQMLARGFFVRALQSHFGEMAFGARGPLRGGVSQNLVRITVGDREQNVNCVRAMREVVCPLGATADASA